MNDLLHKLINTINCNVVNQSIEERNRVLNANMTILSGRIKDFACIKDVLCEFPSRDKIEVIFSTVTEESLVLSNWCIEKQEADYNEFLALLDENDELTLQININKEVKAGILSIYNVRAFNEYLLGLEVIDVIKFIESDIQEAENLVFELFDSEMFIATRTILFRPCDMVNAKIDNFNRSKRIKECRKNCYAFWGGTVLPIPDDFHFVVDNLRDNPYKNIFAKIESLLSIIYISDDVHFEKDKVICQIMGQRMNVHEISYCDIHYNEVLFDIYSWIYTEGNIVDKITLARNLLSMHCRYILIKDIDEKTFMSIKSNFALYQKENVDKYIEIKGKMTELLSNILNQSREIVMDIVSQIGKNIVAYFSFVLTVFISSIMSEKGLVDIFSKDVTYFSYAFILGSIIYMCITNHITKYKVEKLQESYELIKRNNDFFEKTREYEDIFRDEEVENIVKEIKRHKRSFFILWGILVFGVFVIVELLSSYAISGIVLKKIRCAICCLARCI